MISASERIKTIESSMSRLTDKDRISALTAGLKEAMEYLGPVDLADVYCGVLENCAGFHSEGSKIEEANDLLDSTQRTQELESEWFGLGNK